MWVYFLSWLIYHQLQWNTNISIRFSTLMWLYSLSSLNSHHLSLYPIKNFHQIFHLNVGIFSFMTNLSWIYLRMMIDLSLILLSIEYKYFHLDIYIFSFMIDLSLIWLNHKILHIDIGMFSVIVSLLLICLSIEYNYFHEILHLNFHILSFMVHLSTICIFKEFKKFPSDPSSECSYNLFHDWSVNNLFL